MADRIPHPNSVANLIPYKPGQTGNPAGLNGSRRRLNKAFLDRLERDFETHGTQAIVDCREKDPVSYVKVCASLLPKLAEEKAPLEDISDAELVAFIGFVRARMVAAAASAGEGALQAIESQPAH